MTLVTCGLRELLTKRFYYFVLGLFTFLKGIVCLHFPMGSHDKSRSN